MSFDSVVKAHTLPMPSAHVLDTLKNFILLTQAVCLSEHLSQQILKPLLIFLNNNSFGNERTILSTALRLGRYPADWGCNVTS